MDCIPPNPRRVGYIVPIHGPLDGPLYMSSIYSNTDDELDFAGQNKMYLQIECNIDSMYRACKISI